jgi:hypothetical protein
LFRENEKYFRETGSASSPLPVQEASMKMLLLSAVAALALSACGYDRNTKMEPVEPTQGSTASDPNAAAKK